MLEEIQRKAVDTATRRYTLVQFNNFDWLVLV